MDMGKEGVEPSQPYGQRILSPSCMPFHHLPNLKLNATIKTVLSLDFSAVSLLHRSRYSKNYKLKAWTGFEPVNSGFVLRLLSHFIPSSLRIFIKATIGIEPMYSGFADHCLTTWLRRHQCIPDLKRPEQRLSKYPQSPPDAPRLRYRRPDGLWWVPQI